MRRFTSSQRQPPTSRLPRPRSGGLVFLFAYLLMNSTGCYRWAQVPDGLQQKPINLKVGELVQRYTEIAPKPIVATPLVAKKPGVLLLHSGFSGDEIVTADLGRALAGHGVVVLMPAYRGQLRRLDDQRSDGKIEFCKGEVQDAEAGLNWLRQQPEVDPARIAVMGLSHGGCIGLHLAGRAPWLRALVTMSAPVAIGPLIEHLEATRFQTFFYNGILA
ncbi:MAG TPA: dienelactone hydrolase family protein, partial [Pseudomonadota bacterium]|nr:dienelactone hydrolase family protein [Pseudomonadota bacterium]